MKELKFIHITKCAGSTIEELGKKNGILWGRHHKEYGWWHEFFPHKHKNLKNKYDWFMVVRNPYDRIISEFYCNWGGAKKNENFTNKEFNDFIKEKIVKRYRHNFFPNYKKFKGNHYSEQFKYIENKSNIHIVHFENIKKEFDQLMKKYNINIKFDLHVNASTKKKKFSKKSLSPELINIINRVYHFDFVKFGYKKIEV